jgi:hypothetical protein
MNSHLSDEGGFVKSFCGFSDLPKSPQQKGRLQRESFPENFAHLPRPHATLPAASEPDVSR